MANFGGSMVSGKSLKSIKKVLNKLPSDAIIEKLVFHLSNEGTFFVIDYSYRNNESEQLTRLINEITEEE